MAIYHGTFACGCEGSVRITGPSKLREWKKDRAFGNICDECYKKQLEAKREKINEEALEQAKEMELPELEGTEKQVPWATTIRNTYIDELQELIERVNNTDKYAIQSLIRIYNIQKEDVSEMDELTELILDYLIKSEELIIATKLKASFWIDQRHEDIYKLLSFVSKEVAINEIEQKQEVDVIKDSALSPLEVKFDGIVEIRAMENEIKVIYEKNETLISIVKKLRFKWTGTWSRKLTETTGSYVDRAAEVGNKLLNAGFTISIQDDEIRKKAVSGDYAKECKRWIYIRSTGNYEGYLAINWTDESDLYNKARKLPKSKWDKPSVMVNISHYNEVEEFADLYDFRFTKKALDEIDQYKIRMENIEQVSPVEVKNTVSKDGLNEILNSPDKVLEDLMD